LLLGENVGNNNKIYVNKNDKAINTPRAKPSKFFSIDFNGKLAN